MYKLAFALIGKESFDQIINFKLNFKSLAIPQ